jgi:ABC-2 type transport system ATP-binding protein
MEPVTASLEVSGLAFAYPDGHQALFGVDFTIARGERVALLGPNGAGKTTLIRMLATLTRPDQGHARVLGHDLLGEAQAIRRRVSLTGQFASIDEDLTGWENLVLLARLLGHRRPQAKARADQLLGAFGLADAANRQASKYSGGMRRRLDIAASIVVTPDLIFLDEPTTGLDPSSRHEVWRVVRALAADGCTVVLTTQYLDEADQLADRFAVIDQGAVIAEGTGAALKALVGTGVLLVRVAEPGQRPAAAQLMERTLRAAVRLDADPAALSAEGPGPAQAAHLLSELAHAGIELSDYGFGHPTLDEAFLALVGGDLLEPEAV